MSPHSVSPCPHCPIRIFPICDNCDKLGPRVYMSQNHVEREARLISRDIVSGCGREVNGTSRRTNGVDGQEKRTNLIEGNQISTYGVMVWSWTRISFLMERCVSVTPPWLLSFMSKRSTWFEQVTDRSAVDCSTTELRTLTINYVLRLYINGNLGSRWPSCVLCIKVINWLTGKKTKIAMI